jgi:heptosyltransferase-2
LGLYRQWVPPQDEWSALTELTCNEHARIANLLVPYMWIGDFRSLPLLYGCQSAISEHPIDVLTTLMVAPLLDYMPGVRGDRGRLAAEPAWPSASIAARQAAGGGGYVERHCRGPEIGIGPRARRDTSTHRFPPSVKPASAWLMDLRFASDSRAWSSTAARRLPYLRGRSLANGCRNSRCPRPNWRARRERLGLAPDGRVRCGARAGRGGAIQRWPAAHYADWRNARGRGNPGWVIGGRGKPRLARSCGLAWGDIRDLTGPDPQCYPALAAANTVVSNDPGLL